MKINKLRSKPVVVGDKAIKAKGPAISHYVKSSFERISAMGATALRCDLMPNGATDGKDALRISYYDPATAVPPRPWRPTDGLTNPAFDTILIASGEISPLPHCPSRIGLVLSPGFGSNRLSVLRAHVHQLTEASAAAPGAPTAFLKDFQFSPTSPCNAEQDGEKKHEN